MSDSDITPFKGKRAAPQSPMWVLHRFTKPGGHVAEIRERQVTQFKALEFFVFVDHSLVESQMFHGARVTEYARQLEQRVRQFTDGGWTCDPPPPRGEQM